MNFEENLKEEFNMCNYLTPKNAISEMLLNLIDIDGEIYNYSLMFIKYGITFNKVHCQIFEFDNEPCCFVDRNIANDGYGFFVGVFGTGEDLSTYTGKKFEFRTVISNNEATIEIFKIYDVDLYIDDISGTYGYIYDEDYI